ncbi:hypothetical protein LAWI1_G006420 [Lachnellula willkommii]|uniref:BTB domain-containing protein n=1 Tax=Lachnellula willkommii TaxID=215461 RepID=A0A559M3C1_9HELO|nr:hypothetical protein LAWI1_G006420 [Lachnellula willkommii]
MPPGQKRKASEDSSSVPEASKRAPRSEKEEGSRPSFVDATEMVKINVFESPSNDNKEGGEKVNSAEVTKKPFLVHKAILCHYSPFFDAAFNGGFEEDTTQELDLPDTDPIVFGILVEWAYSQRVMMSTTETRNDLFTLMKLWVLADRCLIPRLQNETLVYLEARRAALSGTLPRLDTFTYLYDNTAHRSPLRQYFAHLASNGMVNDGSQRPELTSKVSKRLPHLMLVDIITCMIEQVRNPEFKGGRVRSMKLSEEELQKFYVPLKDMESL